MLCAPLRSCLLKALVFTLAFVALASLPAQEMNPLQVNGNFKLHYANGKAANSTTTLAGKKYIGLYFSAHWCGPCRAFTPTLIKFYQQCREKNLPIEILFVSSDNSEKGMFDYMKEAGMPWPAVSYGHPIREQLKKHFNVTGIPTLRILRADGSILIENGRYDIVKYGFGAYQRWMNPKHVPTTYEDLQKQQPPQATPTTAKPTGKNTKAITSKKQAKSHTAKKDADSDKSKKKKKKKK